MPREALSSEHPGRLRGSPSCTSHVSKREKKRKPRPLKTPPSAVVVTSQRLSPAIRRGRRGRCELLRRSDTNLVATIGVPDKRRVEKKLRRGHQPVRPKSGELLGIVQEPVDHLRVEGGGEPSLHISRHAGVIICSAVLDLDSALRRRRFPFPLLERRTTTLVTLTEAAARLHREVPIRDPAVSPGGQRRVQKRRAQCGLPLCHCPASSNCTSRLSKTEKTMGEPRAAVIYTPCVRWVAFTLSPTNERPNRSGTSSVCRSLRRGAGAASGLRARRPLWRRRRLGETFSHAGQGQTARIPSRSSETQADAKRCARRGFARSAKATFKSRHRGSPPSPFLPRVARRRRRLPGLSGLSIITRRTPESPAAIGVGMRVLRSAVKVITTPSGASARREESPEYAPSNAGNVPEGVQ
ncbi:hypothetical protein MTO96_002434 [Rhipicephalus appendiculatus]